jgi:PAS domain-containing protein
MGLKERLKNIMDTDKNLQKGKVPAGINEGINTEIAKEMAFKAFSNAPRPMAISNLETGIYVDVNVAFLKTLGYKKKDIIGQTSDDIQVFADIEESNKYIRLLSRFNKVIDFPVNQKINLFFFLQRQ